MFLVKPLPLSVTPSPHFQAHSSGSLKKTSEFLSHSDVSLKHCGSRSLAAGAEAAGLRVCLWDAAGLQGSEAPAENALGQGKRTLGVYATGSSQTAEPGFHKTGREED